MIYSGLELIGITNIGLSIILFTVLYIFAFMTPLQIKQQKFSKLSAVMQPEIQKIQKKYHGKKDQDSMMKHAGGNPVLYIRNMVYLQQEAVYSCCNSDAGSAGSVSGNLEHSWLCWKCKKRIYRCTAKIMCCRWIWQISSASFITDNKMTSDRNQPMQNLPRQQRLIFCMQTVSVSVEKFSQMNQPFQDFQI